MSPSWAYPVAPIATWVAAGSCKFLMNSVRRRRLAFDRIGLGGAPSTHTSIVIAMLTLVMLREGLATPATGIAATLALIVIIDATDLRRKVGLHASQLQRLFPADEECRRLRTSIGHTLPEILAGIAVGACCGGALFAFSAL